MFGNSWYKKERPLLSFLGFGGGGTGLALAGGAGPGIDASGGVISDYSDGTDVYRAHIFIQPGTFVVSDVGTLGGTADIHLVAGGGGGAGGSKWAGGGGGGGVLETTEYPLGALTYPITVGTGGQGGATQPIWSAPQEGYDGIQGGNTVFTDPSGPSVFTALGGGYGGGGNPGAPSPGGSAGGGIEGSGAGGPGGQPDVGDFTGYGNPTGWRGPNRGSAGGGAGSAGGVNVSTKYPGGTGGVAPNRSYWTDATPLSYPPGFHNVVAGDGRANSWADGSSVKYAGGGGGALQQWYNGNTGIGNIFLTGLPNPFTGETITRVDTGPSDLSGGKGGDFFQGTDVFGVYGPTPNIDGAASYNPGVSRIGMIGLGGGGGAGSIMEPRNPESPQPSYPNPLTPYPAEWGGSTFNGNTPAPDSYAWDNQRGGNGGSGTVVIRYKIAAKQSSTDSAKATGGKISYYNSKVIHTFFHPGKFVAPAQITGAEIVVIGGGGGGGCRHGGGGGAGAYNLQTSQTIPAATHVVKVGHGGAVSGPISPPWDGRQDGNPGEASLWASPGDPWQLIAPGGGGGAGGSGPNQVGNPSPGGSGGGGAANPTAGTGGPMGNPGGGGTNAAPVYTGGGGGGFGGPGPNGDPEYAGAGGYGVKLPTTFQDPRAVIGAPGPGAPPPGPHPGADTKFWVCGGGGGGVNNDAPPSSFENGGGGGKGTAASPWSGAGPGGGVTPGGDSVQGTAGAYATGAGGGGGGCNNPDPTTGPPHAGWGGPGGPGLVLIAYDA